VTCLEPVGSGLPEDAEELELELALCCVEHLNKGHLFVQALGDSLMQHAQAES
jgi:hypothetical protein